MGQVGLSVQPAADATAGWRASVTPSEAEHCTQLSNCLLKSKKKKKKKIVVQIEGEGESSVSDVPKWIRNQGKEARRTLINNVIK